MNTAPQTIEKEQQAPKPISILKNVLFGMVDGFIPLGIYLVCKGIGWSDVSALIAGSVIGAALNIINFVRRRSFDVVGVLVLVGLVASLVVAFLGGDAHLLLLRESLVSSLFGFVALISLLFPRPLFFYLVRRFRTLKDPARKPEFDALWNYSTARRCFRVVTAVWGMVTIGELIVRIVMIYTLSVATVLAISPIVFNVILLLLIVWTWRYLFSTLRQVHQQQA
jgi:hypothetical protein